ncbi:hypothetical protein X801_02971, partial [Opisthorchis viverrini]
MEGVKESLAKQTLHLKKALEDIKDSNESMRKERTAFISQCRSKLKDYDECIWQNEKLRLFVDTWIKKSPNFELTAPEKDEVPQTQTFQLPERDGDSHAPPEKLNQQHREIPYGPNLEDTSRLRLSALDTSALLTE